MEKRQRVESKVLTVMIYPVVLVAFCLLAILILTTKVIPTIGAQIQRAGQELPWITQQLMNFSGVLMSWRVLILLAALVLIVMGSRRFFRTDRGAYLRDRFLLSLPVFGPLIKERVVARFASTLSTLIGSGLSVAESLRVVSETTGNTLMRRAIQLSRDRILAGADIATPLRDSGVIDPAIAHMVAVGEKNAFQKIRGFHQIADVGDDQVNAQHVAFGEHQAAVYGDGGLPALEHGHVLAHFPHTAHGDDA
jgi:type II secretory pathway component PulF